MSVYRAILFWGILGLLLTMQVVQAPAAWSDLEWLTSTIYDDYVQSDRVPLPWTPVIVGENSVHVWGRSMSWSSSSILPSSIKTQGVELLKTPMRLVATIGGVDYTVPLSSLTVTERKNTRVTMTAQGSVQNLSVAANMFMEYDGFLWVRFTVTDTVAGRQIGGLKVVAELDKQYMKLFQTFGGQVESNDLYGLIGSSPLQIAWNPTGSIVDFYQWFGNPDLGIGFTYTTLKNWKPASINNYATLIPGATAQTYRINLIESSTAMNGQAFEFGIQATPIKPLPPDYHSWMTSRISYHPYKAWNRIPENIDVVTSFQQELMPGLNAPYKVSDGWSAYVDWAHGKGVGVTTIPACPQRISEQSDEFATYANAWKALPENILKWPDSAGVDQYLNCGGSETLRKWNFYGWAVENVTRFGTEGIYFDGWMAGQMGCNNPAHGHGWVDSGGVRRLEVPVLEGREFNRVMALYLQDNVDSQYYAPPTAPERPGFPKYHYWIHSWSFVPSVMGHATMWLSGEEAGYKNGGTYSGKTLGQVYGLGGVYSKCLSTNWGVVNAFMPCIWEADDPADPGTTDHQTLSMFAWLLPHGIPLGMMDYMNADRVVEIAQIMMDFETRKAEFTPAWRPNPYIEVQSPVSDEVVAATWAHPTKRKVLAVVSNLRVSQSGNVTLAWKGLPNPKVKDARTGQVIPVQNNTITVSLNPESFVLLLIEYGSGLQPGTTGFLVPWRDSYKVTIYDSQWNRVRDFVTFEEDEYGFIFKPSAVAQDKTTGDVYVAVTTDVNDYWGGSILKFDCQGNQIPGWIVEYIGYVTGLAVRNDGKLFVCDQLNNTFMWYSTSDSSVFGEMSAGPDLIEHPCDLTIDSQGRVLLADFFSVKRWNADLTYDRMLLENGNIVDVKVLPGTGDLRVLRWDGYLFGYDSEGTWTGPYYQTAVPPYAQGFWIDPTGGEKGYYRAASGPGGGIQRGVYFSGSHYWETLIEEGDENGFYARDIEPFEISGSKLDVTVELQDYKGDLSLVAVKVDVLKDGMLVDSKTVTPTALSSVISFELEPGEYVVRASATQWLTRETTVNVTNDATAALSLPNGDVYGDNQIDTMDFLILKNSFDKVSD